MARHPFLERTVDELTRLVESAAANHEAGGADRRGVLIALSGGPDSVALLLAACAWRDETSRPLAAAHLNHRLRGQDADQDEAFCRDLCARQGVVLHTRTADPRPLARARGRGVEEAARVLRREFFASVLASDPMLACVATGHHRDDQVETVVMRLWRGCGLDGLAGLRPVAGPVIHPLLSVTRAQIVDFLATVGQPWREDATNAADMATRNRVRRELLPLVRDIFGSGAAEAPARLADLAAGDLDLLNQLSDQGLASCLAGDGALDVPALGALEPALQRRVLRHWIADTMGTTEDITNAHIEALREWLAAGQSGQRFDLPRGLRLWRDFDRLRNAPPPPQTTMPTGPAAEYQVRVTPAPGPVDAPPTVETDVDGGRLTCPASALQGHVRVANWRHGDAIAPLGLGGHKKLSDLFQEKRIPVRWRPQVLVVHDEAGILWVVGVAQAERTRVLPTTARVVTIQLERRSASPGSANR